jgi:hypothetical protein
MGQRTWFIDDSANVENTGATSGSPVPSAERRRRMGTYPIWENGAYHIRYLATTAADVIEGECGGINTVVYLHSSDTDRVGVSPVAHTSSALDVLNTATNTPFAVTAGTLGAAAAIDKRIRWTNGPAAGSHAWGTVNNSATKLRTTEFLEPAASFNVAPFVAPTNDPTAVAAPVSGNTFVVEDIRTVSRLRVTLRSSPGGPSGTTRIVLDGIATTIVNSSDCGIYSDGSAVSTAAGTAITYHYMYGCKVRFVADLGRKHIVGGYAPDGGGRREFVADLTGVNYSLIDHFTMQGDKPIGLAGSSLGPQSWAIGHIGMFDSVSPEASGIYIESLCRFAPSTAATVIYGSNNTGQPFVMTQEGALIVQGSSPVTPIVFTVPAIIGITTGGLVSRHSVPAYDTASGLWTEPRLLSIANLLATVPSGGFGGVMKDPYTGARMIG